MEVTAVKLTCAAEHFPIKSKFLKMKKKNKPLAIIFSYERGKKKTPTNFNRTIQSQFYRTNADKKIINRQKWKEIENDKNLAPWSSKKYLLIHKHEMAQL